MMFSQCNTCAMVIYFTIQYQGGCGHIEGHAYSVLSVLNETCILGFHVYVSLIIASCTPENIIIQVSEKPLNNMLADTIGEGLCLF